MLILLGLNRIKKKMKYPNYYVQHYQKEDDKVKWCYIGSNNKLPDEYKIKINYYEDQTLHNYTQQYNDFTQHQKKQESTFISQNDDRACRADRLVWLGYHLYEVMVAGSNPARPTQPF